MRIFRIHPSPTEPHIVTVACEGDENHALILAKRNPWVEQRLGAEAVARECEELFEEVG